MKNTRARLLAGFGALASLAFFAAHSDARPETIVKIVDGVWFREGDLKNLGHCNNIVIEMKDYLIVVDANFPSGARLALADAKKVSSKPVKYVFDTHHHGDHAYGNAIWTDAGATTLAYKGVVEEMKRRVTGMVGGQYLDIAGTAPPGPDGLRRLHELKTGRLIGASVDCVLLLAGTPEPATIAYRSFAAELGVLFQIVDDILDVTGNQTALGKSPHSDERLGKRTYVSEFGLERARDLAAESHHNARAALEQAAPDGAARELEQVTDFVYTRSS